MHQNNRPLKVALVFPPFGPQFIPSLGLATLSARVKQLGFECRTFYWNLDFARALPAATPDGRIRMYEGMTKLQLSPLNEWIFARIVFPEAVDDPRVLRRLQALESAPPRRRRLSSFGQREAVTFGRETFLGMRDRSSELVDAMVDRLAPFDVIGIASTFFQNMPALAVARRAKERFPGKTIVLGGANCDELMGSTLLEQFTFLDYVFSGEVDFSFAEFVKRLSEGRSVSDVPGLVYRAEDGRVVRAPSAPPLEDMNSLPVPDYDDFVAQRAASDLGTTTLPLTVALESSRGCWWGAKQHCVFCGLNANGMAYRQKDYHRFQSEVEQIVDRYQPRFLFMTDNILSAGYYKEFADWTQRRGLGIDFFYEIKANLNRNQVEGMADSGISWIQPGIESFSSSTLTLMKKGVRGIQNVALLKYARDNGMKTSYGILGGFSGDDPDEYARMTAQLPKLVHLEPPAGAWKAQYHRFSPMFREPPSKLRPIPEYAEMYPLPEEVIAGFAYYFEPTIPQEFPHFDAVNDKLRAWKDVWNPATCTLTWEEIGGEILVRDRRPGFGGHDFRLADHAVAVFHALDKPRQLQGLIRELQAEAEAEVETEALATPALAMAGAVSGAPAERFKFLRMIGTLDRPAAQQDIPRAASTATPAAKSANQGGQPSANSPVRAKRQAPRNPANEIVVSFTRQEFADRPEACLAPLVAAAVLYVEDDWYLTLPVKASHRPFPVQWQYEHRSRLETLMRVFSLGRGHA